MAKNKQIPIKEQEEILATDDKNMIVSASAGSGKTSVMIRKIFKYIENGNCHCDELLVLTYTKAAAMEMKKKLVDKIRENATDNEELLGELDRVQTADISTFDSFCQKLVKKYFYVLSIDPSFSILEGGEKDYEQSISLSNAIRQMKEKNPEGYEHLLQNLSPKRDEEKIKSVVLQIYEYVTSILKIDEFYKKTLSFYDKNNSTAEDFLNNYYSSIVTAYKNELEKLLTKSNNLNFVKYSAYISNLIVICENFLREPSFKKKVDLISDYEYGTLYKDRLDDIGFRDEIADVKDKLKKNLDDISQTFISSNDISLSYDYCGKLMQNIFSLLNIFIHKYDERKQSINKYDFNDVERFTIMLLENKTINQQIKMSYKYIFIDEFQDANMVQEKIIFELQNNNLFFVGDTKQSIYAFRQSDPDIFLNIERNFENDDLSEAKVLNCNFRTNKNILNFVNKVFNVIMTEKTAGLNYEKKAQFDPKAPYEDLENETCVSLNLINKDEGDAEKIKPTAVYDVKENASNLTQNNKYDKECLFVCNKIAELIGQNIYDKDLEITRNIELSDITILLQKRGTFQNCLIKHFIDLGIPYTVSSNDNIEELYDNVVLFNLIKLVINKKDDYVLYSVISSNLFEFTDGDFATIRSNTDCEYFYQAINEYVRNNSDYISEKIKAFYNFVKQFSFDAKYKGIYYALSKIIRDTNYLLKISHEDDYPNRKVGIETFINSFVNSKYNYDICGYINFREATTKGQLTEASRPAQQAVQIATMHSSKGLEYPVVILPNLDQNYFKNHSDGELAINKEFGVGVKLYNEDERTVSRGIFYEACRLKNKQIEISERIRLLYVAMTRAKNKLVLSGLNSKKFKHINNDLQVLNDNNYLSLIVGCLNEDILNKINSGENFTQNLFGNIRLVVEADRVEVVDEIKTSELLPKYDDLKYVHKLAEFLNKNFDNQHKTLALKNSVSGFAFDDYSSVNLSPQKLFKDEHLTETSTDAGTLYHEVLEKIEFNNINNVRDVEQFVECNFGQEEIKQISKFGYENIYENIELLKPYTQKGRVLKEQKFVMKIPHKEIVEDGDESRVLVQGVADLIVILPNQVFLFDYKHTNKSDEKIISTYKKQIDIYTKALSLHFKNAQIKRFILNLTKNKLIEL